MAEIGSATSRIPQVSVQNPVQKPVQHKAEKASTKTDNPVIQNKDTDKTNKNTQSHDSKPVEISFNPTAKTDKASTENKIENGKVLSTNVKATTYCPDVNSAMEGGTEAKFSKADLRDHTLEKYLKNPEKTGFVAIAIDEHVIKSGKLKPDDQIRIPELEKKFGKGPIIFKAIDTGAAFTGGSFGPHGNFKPSKKYHEKGLGAIDICTNVKGALIGQTFSNVTMIKMNK